MSRRSSFPPPRGDEAVLALVALGRITETSAPLYTRALSRLGRAGLIERGADGAFRVAGAPSASPPVPAEPPLETLVTRVPPSTLAELDAMCTARGPDVKRSTIAREVIAAGIRALTSESGVRRKAS